MKITPVVLTITCLTSLAACDGKKSSINSEAAGTSDVQREGTAVTVPAASPLPNLKIELDRAAAARHGINAADVAELIATGIGGTPIGQLYIGEKSYDMTVRFPEKYRFSKDAIGNLTLKAPTGERVPLSDVARISTVSGESVIVREMAQRNIIVRLNVRDRDLASFLSDAQAIVEREVRFDHKRIQIKWGGQFENLERTEARLALILPMTLGIMFLPLFGVAVLNGVLMIAQINRLRDEEGKRLRDAVLEGARSRMRPVLMTATVAALGLTPAMLATGLGSDVQRPLATVVVGGLLTATVLTLVLLPSLYHLIEDRIARRQANTAAPIASEQGAQ